jgi:hypothetical protein
MRADPHPSLVPSPSLHSQRVVTINVVCVAVQYVIRCQLSVLDVAYLTNHMDSGAMAFTQRKYLLPRLAAETFRRDEPKHTTQHSQVIHSLFVDHLNSVT